MWGMNFHTIRPAMFASRVTGVTGAGDEFESSTAGIHFCGFRNQLPTSSVGTRWRWPRDRDGMGLMSEFMYGYIYTHTYTYTYIYYIYILHIYIYVSMIDMPWLIWYLGTFKIPWLLISINKRICMDMQHANTQDMSNTYLKITQHPRQRNNQATTESTTDSSNHSPPSTGRGWVQLVYTLWLLYMTKWNMAWRYRWLEWWCTL